MSEDNKSRVEKILHSLLGAIDPSDLQPAQSRVEALLLALDQKFEELGDLAGKLPIHICTSGEFNQLTGIPTIENPETDIFYLVPDGSENDLYSEWIYTGDKWEYFGEKSQRAIDAADEARQSATAAAASATAAQEVLNNIHSDYTTMSEDVDELKTYVRDMSPVATVTAPVASVSDAAPLDADDVTIAIEPVQAGSGDPSPENVRPITGWTGAEISHSGADTSDPNVISITFPTEAGTVYGGTLDLTVGKLVVDRAMVDMGMFTFYLSSIKSSIGGNVFTINVSTLGMAERERYTPNQVLSSRFATAPKDRWYIDNMLDNEMFVNKTNLYISASQYDTTSDFKAAMSGVQLVYELATPITYNLTPQEIAMFRGANTLWANTGDATLIYRQDVAMLLSELIAAQSV